MDMRENETLTLTLKEREIQNEKNALSCTRIEPLSPYSSSHDGVAMASSS
jgi:hypothetical protein